MTKIHSQKFIALFILGFLLISLGCSFRKSNTNSDHSNNASSSPIIFYEQKTVAGFDAGGTPFGPSTLYRKDGINAKPVSVLSLGSASAFPSTVSNFSVENGNLIQEERGSDSLLTTTYDGSGKQLSRKSETIGAGFTPQMLTSKDGNVSATATMACTEIVENGPCNITFHLKITNRTAGTTKTLEQKDFPNSIGGGFRAEPIIFTPDRKKLIVYVTQFGDYINTASLNVIDLANYSVTQLLKANYPNPTNPTNIDRLNFIRTSADGATIWAERDFGERVDTGELLKITVNPWKVEKLADIVPSIEAKYIKFDDSGTIVSQSPDGGFSYLDFSTGQKQVLTDKGYFLGWSHDGQCYLYQVYDDVHNGLGPFRLMVGSMATGAQTEIVRQTVTAQNVKTTTKVGDILYAPVGIW